MINYVGDILNYFPSGATPRDSQVKALKGLQEGLRNNKKFIIAQLPTGAGKSHIASTLATLTSQPPKEFADLVDTHEILNKVGRISEEMLEYAHAEAVNAMPSFGCYVLTTTKNLQNQYGDLFSDGQVLKGKRNYQCSVDSDFDCEIAPCVVDPNLMWQCLQNHTCPYYNAFEDALKNKFSILSYSKFAQLPQFLKRRAIIVCDEASGLEEEIVNQFSATIEYTKLAKEGIAVKKLKSDDAETARGWINDLLIQLKQLKKELYEKVFRSRGKRAQEVVNTIKLKYVSRLFDSLLLVSDNWDQAKFLIETDQDKTSFVPLQIHSLTKTIFDHADHVVLMSATIIDHRTFAKTLGIEDYKYIETESAFDPKISPIYCPGKYSLKWGDLEQNISKVVEQALKICEYHKGQNGVIHTFNFKINNAFQKAVGLNRRFLFREHGITNERIVEEHFARKDGTVLVSPSLGFGTNLLDEAGRFQIIVKLPYLPLGSNRVKTLADKDRKWYLMKMLTHLVQMAGRCTRSETDYADTYILDGLAVKVLKQNWNNLPRWFKERLV